MAVSEAIRTRLLAVSGVADITSGVYCGDSPQSATIPRIEIHELTADAMLSMDGTSGLRGTTIDIDCKANTMPVAHALADAVEAAINDYTGTVGSVAIKAVMLQDRGDSKETPQPGKGFGVAVTTLDYLIQHS